MEQVEREMIRKAVADTFGPCGMWIYTKAKRDRKTTRIRRAAMWAARAAHGATFRDVADVFGYTASHVCQAVRLAEAELAADHRHRRRAIDLAGAMWGRGDG